MVNVNPDNIQDPNLVAEETVTVGPVDLVLIYICAAIGGFIAAIADLVQKEEASAVVKLTSISARHLDYAMAPLYILIALVLLSIGLCLVFQPSGRRHSFGIGISVVAVIMTFTPYQQPPTGAARPADQVDLTWHGFLHKAVLVSEEQDSSSTLSFVVNNDTAAEAVISVSVFVPARGSEFYQKELVFPGTEIELGFDLSTIEYGEMVSFVVEVDGIDMPIRIITVGEDDMTIPLHVTTGSEQQGSFQQSIQLNSGDNSITVEKGIGPNILPRLFKRRLW